MVNVHTVDIDRQLPLEARSLHLQPTISIAYVTPCQLHLQIEQ